MDPSVAVIVVVPVDPVDNEVASPLKLVALLMAATDGVDEFQVTDAVKSRVDESEEGPPGCKLLGHSKSNARTCRGHRKRYERRRGTVR